MAESNVPPVPFESWESVYRFEIPQVQKYEVEITRSASDAGQRLRSIVMKNFRQRVDCSKKVVTMHETMNNIEEAISNVVPQSYSAKLCRVTPSSALGISMLSKEALALAYGAQLDVLHNCMHILAITLRQGNRILASGKIWVLANRVDRNLSQSPSEMSDFLMSIRRKVAIYRAAIVDCIGVRLSLDGGQMNDLDEYLAAYLLVTNQSLQALFIYFLGMRSQAVKCHFTEHNDSTKAISQALRAYLNTLQHTRLVFSTASFGRIRELTSGVLVNDHAIRSITEVNMDLNIAALPSAIRDYKLSFLNDLDNALITNRLQTWKIKTFRRLLTGAGEALLHEQNVNDIKTIRRNFIEELYTHEILLASADIEVLQEFREVFRTPILRLLKSAIDELVDGFSFFNSRIKDIKLQHDADDMMWCTSSTEKFEPNSIGDLKELAISSALGRVEESSKVVQWYDNWCQMMLQLLITTNKMKTERWERLYEKVLDDTFLDGAIKQLTRDDPEVLLDASFEWLSKAYQSISGQLQSVAEGLRKDDDPVLALHLIRLFRDLERKTALFNNCVSGKIFVAGSSFDLRINDNLLEGTYENISRFITEQAWRLTRHHFSKFTKAPLLSGRSLWEGEPPLPTIISHCLFRHLRSLCDHICEYGTDVWSVRAKEVLRMVVARQAQRIIFDCIAQLAGSAQHESNVDISSPESTSTIDGDAGIMKKEKAIQFMFDIKYLRLLLVVPHNDDAVEDLLEKIQIDTTLHSRLDKYVAAYFGKTHLLFSLLSI